MEGGRLRHRIDLQRRVETKRPNAELIFSYVHWQTVWADVMPDKATEYFVGQGLTATENAKIRIRYQPGIESTMRVKHVIENNVSPEVVEYWDVQGAVHVKERRREIHLMCLKWHAEGFRGGDDG